MKASVYQCFIIFVSVWCSHKPLGRAVRDVVLEFDHDNNFQKDKIVSSQYRGRFDIESQGTLENIKVMIDKCVVGNVPMMAIMTFGAAATALSYSNKVWNTNIYNPTFSYPVQDTMTVHHNWLCLSR